MRTGLSVLGNLRPFLFPVVGMVVMIGSSNAVNLTDGLDGLAIVPTIIAAAVFALISYLVGNRVFADYLQLHPVAGVGELGVFLAALVGSGLGFLWFNAPPAAVFHYSRDRRGEHPCDHLAHYGGILQADAYAGYNELFKSGRAPGAVTRALCWAHARRKFFVLADVATQVKRKPNLAPVVSPLALEAVTRIDRIFDIERGICGKTADERLAVRRELAAPLVAELEQWLREQRATLSRLTPVAKAINYMLGDWTAFTRFLADGRICLTNNAAERGLRKTDRLPRDNDGRIFPSLIVSLKPKR